ncbi:hypothetical protein HN51_061894 [Arachis hypogaea]|nr:Homeobox-leucine zipper protein [Arachis hypogaea]
MWALAVRHPCLPQPKCTCFFIFQHHSTFNPKQKQELANKLHLRTRQIELWYCAWFQNKRAGTKLKQMNRWSVRY